MPHLTYSQIQAQIALNAAEIVRLHKQIHETVLLRDKNKHTRQTWQNACAEFYRRYDGLAFPGGYGAAMEKFRSGDNSVIEPALCFLELRPYFFRSGYMFQVLLRRVKRAPLTDGQKTRLAGVLERREAWKARKGRWSAQQNN
jgi:hypothetical protein